MANIDGETVPMQRTGTNLWTAPWAPKYGAEGTVRIDVNTSTGNASSVHQYKTNYDSIKSSTVSLKHWSDPVFIPMNSKKIECWRLRLHHQNRHQNKSGIEKCGHVTVGFLRKINFRWPIFSIPDSFWWRFWWCNRNFQNSIFLESIGIKFESNFCCFCLLNYLFSFQQQEHLFCLLIFAFISQLPFG